MLRRAGLTTEVIACVSVGILARRRDYYAALTAYRGGGEGIGRIIELVADAADQAGRAGTALAPPLVGMAEQWEDRLGGVRSGSASAELLAALRGSLGSPGSSGRSPLLTVDAAWLTGRAGTSSSSAHDALTRFVEAGVLTEVSDSARSRVFSSVGVVTALEVLTATP